MADDNEEQSGLVTKLIQILLTLLGDGIRDIVRNELTKFTLSQETLLLPEEAGIILRVSKETIYKYFREGQLDAIQLHGKDGPMRFRWTVIQDFLVQRTVRKATPEEFVDKAELEQRIAALERQLKAQAA